MTTSLKVKGLNELNRKMNRIARKMKTYEGTHNIKLPFTQQQWNKMSDSERKYYITKEQNRFAKKMLNDIFN